MFLVKVEYDASNEQFRLVDQKLAHMFHDGEMYVLVVDFLPRQTEINGDYLDLSQTDIGHA